MNRFYFIRDYCSVRKNSVVINNNQVFGCSGTGFEVFSTRLYKHFAINYPKFYKMDSLSKLGFLSVELLLRDKNIDKYAGKDVGIILINASSSLDSDRLHQKTVIDRSNYFQSPAVFVYTLPNIVIGEICIRHKFSGEGTFFIQEKFNPSLMVAYIEHLFDSEIIQCCITGWVEVDSNDFESVVYLIEKTDNPNHGFAKFEAAVMQEIYIKNR
jgi:hypothetical protein